MLRVGVMGLALALVAGGSVALTSVASARGAMRGASQSGWYGFAPYADFAGWPVPELGQLRRASGARDMTLGFIVAENGDRCQPAWGGLSAYPAAGPHPYQSAQIHRFRAHGGDVIPSFGGEAGSELAQVCSSPAALETAYASVISAYGVTHLDFDIEGADVADFRAARTRAAALAALQRAPVRAGRRLLISFTLPVLPTGLTSQDRQVLHDTVSAGVTLTVVNGMTMDYGDSAAPHPAGRMGTFAIQAAKHMQVQLRSLFPRLSKRELASRVGVTPMIGINDSSDEIFTLANARKLVHYAHTAGLGLLSFWQLERDRPCPKPTTTTQLNCSGVAQATWAFSRTLG